MLLDKLVKTTAAAKAEALGNSRRSRLLLVTSTIVLPVLISVVTSREDDFASNGMFWAVVIVLALLQVGLFAIQIAGPQTSQEAYFEGLALAQEVQALSAEKGVLEREVNYQMLLSRSVQTWRSLPSTRPARAEW